MERAALVPDEGPVNGGQGARRAGARPGEPLSVDDGRQNGVYRR
ncbi:hypothetical protein ACWDOR_40870 [Streptosporangium canum]